MDSKAWEQGVLFKTMISSDLQVISPDTKKAFLELKSTLDPSLKFVGTHSEVFHADEVLATSMLRWTQEFGNSVIIRTRNQEILDEMDIVCDVGSVFDAEKLRFDHHQRSFSTYWKEEEEEVKNDANPEQKQEEKVRIKLSSAGLIYKYYGKQVLRKMIEANWGTETTDEDLDKMHEKIYKGLIREIDAIDNGVQLATDQRYNIVSNLSMRVSRFNKAWNAPEHVEQNECFKRAMKIAEEELIWQVYSQSQVVLQAKKIVQKAWDSKEEFHSSGQFVFFDQPCPWKEHLLEIEKEKNQEELLKFVFYQDERKMFRVQGIPLQSNFFDQRVPLCKAWRGLRNEELAKISEIKDMEFVHHGGFIGGAWSIESAIKMAELSIIEQNEEKKLKEQQEAIGQEEKQSQESEKQ